VQRVAWGESTWFRSSLAAGSIAVVVATMLPTMPLAAQPPKGDSLQPDPIPPRMLFRGAAAADARTLAAGRGYAGIGYAGAGFYAQLADFGESRPLIVHAAYGVTDDFTLAAGSGIWNYDSSDIFGGGRDSETIYYHYVAPKLRVLKSGAVSASLGGRLILPAGEDVEGFFYGFAIALSATRERLAGHLSMGVDEYLPPDDYEFGSDVGPEFTVTIRADYSMPLEDRNEFKPFAELWIMSFNDDEFEVMTVGVRFLTGAGLAAELGFARWLEDEAETRPVVSLSYRF